MSAPVPILTEIGLTTAVGDDAESTAAAIRGGISGLILEDGLRLLGPNPEWDPKEPLRFGRVPFLGPEVHAKKRLFELTRTALQQVVSRARLSRKDLGHTALIVATARPEAVPAAWEIEGLAGAIAASLGATFASIDQEASGHVAGLVALHKGAELIRQKHATRVIVVAADTYYDRARVTELDAKNRLRSERSPEGFLPGEAGAAVLLSGARDAEGCTIGGFGQGVEPHGFHSDRLPSGRPLAAAILEAAGDAPLEWVLCDLNGEPVRAAEWGVVQTVLAEELTALKKLEHPAQFVGDLGAASGIFHAALAALALRAPGCPSAQALVWGAADDGARVALSLR